MVEFESHQRHTRPIGFAKKNPALRLAGLNDSGEVDWECSQREGSLQRIVILCVAGEG